MPMIPPLDLPQRKMWLKWFNRNVIKGKLDKFHLLLTTKEDNKPATIGSAKVKNSNSEKLLCITTNDRVNFNGM